ncbi:MAG: bifunctional UDP-sugar hydrolase/5'-nucleotidase [Candidatus Bathyarchaeia archaeon]|jgi:5'-nucleotidase
MNTKKFTILHSNDMHGDFLAESAAGETKLIGGLALLSGYINKVRREEENVLYVIAGDMLQGSLIDSEYKGVSTMGLMNYLAPDVVALGNHEFDYGLSHLLFLEKVANFPIVNANLYIKPYSKRLMRPYLILTKAGFDILFTGIITEKVMDTIKMDPLISSFITLQDASNEIGKICNAYKNDDIDLTILLTHIGFDSDVELAKLLHPDWGVDIIVGGHSHTILEKPAFENGVIIVQAGVGTTHIGRLDVVVDDDTNSVVEYKWQLIPIDEDIAEPDKELSKYIDTYQQEVDQKYNAIICKLAVEHTHPQREVETSLGNLFADAFADNAECHVMFVASGSIRSQKLGPLVTMRDLLTCFPYNDVITRYTLTGEQLTRVFKHIMRKENRNSEGECYQVNGRVRATYSDGEKRLVSLKIDDEDIDPTKQYTICLQDYHAKNSQAYLDVSQEELNAIKTKVVSTSSFEVLEEYLKNNQNTSRRVEGRLVFQP